MGPGFSSSPLRDYWAVLVSRRWVLLLIVATFMIVALIGTFEAVPQYRATTTLHIERHSPDIFTFQGLGQSEMSWTSYTDFYQTQYSILSSLAVARRRGGEDSPRGSAFRRPDRPISARSARGSSAQTS